MRQIKTLEKRRKRKIIIAGHICISLSVPQRKGSRGCHRDSDKQHQTVPFVALLFDHDFRAEGADDAHEEGEDVAEDSHHRAEFRDGD